MALLHSLAEGGQTWAHRIRMLRQVLKISAGMALSVSFSVLGVALWRMDSILHKASWYYLKALLLSPFLDRISVASSFWAAVANQRHPGESVEVSSQQLLRTSEPYFQVAASLSWEHLASASQLFLWVFIATQVFFLVRGKLSKKKEHVSGRRKTSALRLGARLKLTREASDLRVGNLPLVKGTETQHTLISGGTGSGKTNCFHTILPQIRLRRDRAVVVDTTGEFIRRYYREGRDIILNPFDERGASWHPWAECRTSFDYESLAESFIPVSHCERESYWRDAARSLLSSVLQKTEITRSTSTLRSVLLYDSLSDLCEFVAGTRAASHLDINSEKTAASIRSVAASFLSSLDFLPDVEEPFSVRDWVENGDKGSWLFLSMQVSQRAAVRPLVSTWLSVAMRSLLQLNPSRSRRLWFIVDELPSLQRLKDIDTFLVESRKYGGCGLLALQSPSQLEMIYGRDETRIILGNCLTKIAFYEQDPEVASRLSKMFGECELKEFQEGISYGAHQMRDGVNISGQIRNRPVVSPTDIQSLKPNTAYVKLPGNYSISKVKIPIAKDG